MQTYESVSKMRLVVPPTVPPDVALSVIQTAIHEYSNAIQRSSDLGVAITIYAPERPFLLELAGVTIVIKFVMVAGTGAVALHAMKKAIDAVSEIGISAAQEKFRKDTAVAIAREQARLDMEKEKLRQETELEIARQKTLLEVDKERMLNEIKKEFAEYNEEELNGKLAQQLGETIVTLHLGPWIVKRLQDNGLNVK